MVRKEARPMRPCVRLRQLCVATPVGVVPMLANAQSVEVQRVGRLARVVTGGEDGAASPILWAVVLGAFVAAGYVIVYMVRKRRARRVDAAREEL